MARKLKVWAGTSFFKGRQARLLIAAGTKKRIVELANEHGGYLTMGHMNTYWSETGNPAELELVRAAVEAGAGEGAWVSDDNRPRAYERLA